MDGTTRLMSRREYAAHRGCVLSTVQEAVAAGAIPVSRPGPRGRILVEEADALWEPGQRRADAVLPVLATVGGRPRGPAGRRPPGRGGGAPPGSVAALLDEVALLQKRLLAAKAGEREWKERHAQLLYERDRGTLVSRADVRADAQETATRVRAALTSLGARLSTALSCSCRDPGQVQRLIDDEVRRAMDGLQESLFTRDDEPDDADA